MQVLDIPTVEITPLEHRLIPGNVYRVQVANRAFMDGSGPSTKIVTCVVYGNALSFLETDDDVLGFLSPVDGSLLDEEFVLRVFQAFAKLRGLELQVGLPTDTNLWVVSDARDRQVLSLFDPGKQDPRLWEVSIDRSTEGWIVSGVMVSPSSFESTRYVMSISENGHIMLQSVDQVFSFTHI